MGEHPGGHSHSDGPDKGARRVTWIQQCFPWHGQVLASPGHQSQLQLACLCDCQERPKHRCPLSGSRAGQDLLGAFPMVPALWPYGHRTEKDPAIN